jgi:hypothetical protein
MLLKQGMKKYSLSEVEKLNLAIASYLYHGEWLKVYIQTFKWLSSLWKNRFYIFVLNYMSTFQVSLWISFELVIYARSVRRSTVWRGRIIPPWASKAAVKDNTSHATKDWQNYLRHVLPTSAWWQCCYLVAHKDQSVPPTQPVDEIADRLAAMIVSDSGPPPTQGGEQSSASGPPPTQGGE